MRGVRVVVAVLVLVVGSVGAFLAGDPVGAQRAEDPSTTVGTSGAARAGAFVDVPDGHQFAEAIAWMADQEISTGYPDGTFRPADGVSRQAMAAFLHRFVVGGGAAAPACTEAPFPDVAVGDEFCGEIAWLAGAGITRGYEDGRFHPTAQVSRQAMAAFLQRFASTPERVVPCSRDVFGDVGADHRFCGEIAWLADEGIADGFGDGTFGAVAVVSRQAMAAFLHRIVPTPRNGVTLSGGHGHACSLASDGMASCWAEESATPVPQLIPPQEPFAQITTGTDTTCALRADGTVHCQGFAYLWPHVPDGTETDPGIVIPDGLFTQVAGGGFHACGLRMDGSASCWGHDEVMTSVPPLGKFSQLAAGEAFTCGLRLDRTVECWWHSVPPPPDELGAVPVPEGTFEQLAINAVNACGIRTDGSLECWVMVAGGPLSEGPFVQVAAGERHACGLRPDGTVDCWDGFWMEGGNPEGHHVPDGTFIEIAAAWDWTCGKRESGALICWDAWAEWHSQPASG